VLGDSEHIKEFYRLAENARLKKEKEHTDNTRKAEPMGTYVGTDSNGRQLIKYGTGTPIPSNKITNVTPKIGQVTFGGFGSFTTKPRYVPEDDQEFFIFEPEEEMRFPWIGLTEAAIDLLPIPVFGFAAPATVPALSFWGDKFLFFNEEDPREVTEEQPHYVSILSSGALSFLSGIDAGLTEIKTAGVGASAAYVGATAFHDPGAGRVVSAFGDDVAGPWTGETGIGTGPEGGGLSQESEEGYPVGANVFARISIFDGSSTSGTTSPGFANGGSIVSTGDIQDNFFTGNCNFNYAFNAYSFQTRSYSNGFRNFVAPVLVGQYGSIYSSYSTGQRVATTDQRSSTTAVAGQRFVQAQVPGLTAGEGFVGRLLVVHPTQAAESRSTETTTYADFDGFRTYTLGTFDPDAITFSDSVAGLDAVSQSVFQVSVVSGSLPLTVGNQITLRIDSGGYVGEDVRLQTVLDLPASSLTQYHVDDVDEAQASTLEEIFALGAGDPWIDLDENETGNCIPIQTLTQALVNPLRRVIDTLPTYNGDWVRVTRTSNTIAAATQYSYERNPHYSNYARAAQWVLVTSTGQRYILSRVSDTNPQSNYDFSNIESIPNTRSPVTVDSNGSTITLEYSVEAQPNEIAGNSANDIVWDSVVGEIADMTPGSMVLYIANSMENGNFDPGNAQLYARTSDSGDDPGGMTS